MDPHPHSPSITSDFSAPAAGYYNTNKIFLHLCRATIIHLKIFGGCSNPHCLHRDMAVAHERAGEHREILVLIFQYAGEWFALARYLSTSRGWLQRQPALLHEVRGDALLWHEHFLYQDDLDLEGLVDWHNARWYREQRIACMGEMHPDDLERVYEWSSSSRSSSSSSDF